jgi:hypothetical protein
MGGNAILKSLRLLTRVQIGKAIRVFGTVESSATCAIDENLTGGGHSINGEFGIVTDP